MSVDRRTASPSGAIVAFVCALAAAACSNDKGNDEPCKARAAFDLSVTNALGPLPDDTALTVDSNGGIVVFKLDDPLQRPDELPCDIIGDAEDAGDASVVKVVDRLRCKLWTSGDATLTVQASGFPDLVKDLNSKHSSNDCLETVEIDIVLGEPDAGR